MITKYKTAGSVWPQAKIEKTEVERETSASVWIDGRRLSKRGGYCNFFNSFDEAKAYLSDLAEYELKSARLKLQKAQGLAGNVKGLSEDDL